ncbi:glycoside hydrolase [Thelephora terrestris]|uniref:glucan 1,3-beta-glucosidase n=1 Tax=Thelephora terrestris TaxID=56493 RepID=A0A9P6L639_9AGAM|nr:glycoside hydrolase [Thelephora terrestris]
MSSPVPEDSVPSTPPLPENDALNGTQGGDDALPQPPTLANLTPLGTSPRDSLTPSADAPLVSETEKVYDRPIFLYAAAAVVAVIVLAVILPVYFTVIKHKNNTSTGNPNGSNNPSPTSSPNSPNTLTTGGDGSTVTTDNGTQFTYHNLFGGFWVWNPKDPFNDNAQPNSWTPPLNTTWQWGVDQLYGVNIGGWFVLEPFISPALFQKYPDAIDEWTLSTLMAADTASGGLNQLEQHYDTFVTEIDFAEIAGAGLNWVRLPIPYWAIDVWEGEPFLPRTSWTYILRAFQWARKYGLRVVVDLHTAPGSQNGFNHSGKQGVYNFLYGTMGYANAQRMVNYIRIFTEFFTQPQYANVIPMFGIINEALVGNIGQDTLTSFYLESYEVMRAITGTGEGKGAFITLSDGIGGLGIWAGTLPNVDRVALDTHPYFAFGGQANTAPINVAAPDGQMGGTWPALACTSWLGSTATSQTAFGVTISGEYSNGINDCGFFLEGTGPYTPANPDCAFWNDWQDWDQNTKAGLLNFGLASMDALGNPFFWTWKIGPMANGSIGAPLWSYQLGLQNGWISPDPRKSQGKCAALGVTGEFNGTYLPWQTGGGGAGNVPASVSASYPWPPATISGGGVPSVLPQYTLTGSISTLPPPTFTATKVTIDGWYDTGDTLPAPTPMPGCAYPNAWGPVTQLPVPIAGCTPAA